MTPELEAALAPIGWEAVKKISPLFAALMSKKLTPTGGRIVAWAREAAEPTKSLTKTFKVLFEAQKQLGDLSEPFAKRINMAAVGLERLEAGDNDMSRWQPWDPTSEDHIESARDALWSVMAGIEPLLEEIENEAKQSGKGNPKNYAAYAVAEAVLRIYVVGSNQAITLGRREGENKANGLYATTVRNVFQVLGMKVGDAHDNCQLAISELTDDEIATLTALRSGDPVVWKVGKGKDPV